MSLNESTWNNIYIIKNSLPEMLCDDIIEFFEEDLDNNKSYKNFFVIPKKNEKWDKIERFVYKEILIKLNEYKNFLIKNMQNENEIELINYLNNDLFTRDFKIEKCNSEKFCSRSNNRYNVLTFIFYLNEPNDFDNTNITIKKGTLIFLTDTDYHKIKLLNRQYIITGQLCSKNVV